MSSSAILPDERTRPGTSGGGFRAAVFLLFAAPWTAFWGSWSIVFGILRSRRAASFGLMCWAKGLTAVSGVRLNLEWRAQLDSGKPYVFLCNHQSALDIILLMSALLPRHDVRFFAKESLFNIPFMGWGMRCTGFVPIRRENARHSAELFNELLQSKDGPQYCYIIFPEGTRSDDGRLQDLKRGSIGLVTRLGFPVVPVSIVDAFRANPKGKNRLRAGAVSIVFHPPVDVPKDESDRAIRDALLNSVHRTIASALPEDQKPMPHSQPSQKEEVNS